MHSGSVTFHHFYCYNFRIIVSCLDYHTNLLTGVLRLSFPPYCFFSILGPVCYLKTEVRSCHSSPPNPPVTPFYCIQSKSQSLQWPLRPYFPLPHFSDLVIFLPCLLCPGHMGFFAVTHKQEASSCIRAFALAVSSA